MRIEAVNHSLDVLQGSRACRIALECGLELLLERLQPPSSKTGGAASTAHAP